MTVGTRSASGTLIKLEAARVGGRWLTSRAAIERFLAALTDSSPTPIPQTSRSETKRRKVIEAANAKLAAAGA